ncbi:MAG TPA: ABC transporter permease [Gemmatimonadaceae bacterium]|nr:ABC transporter permease [Gemmatimonadaceae bacterium]
MSIWRQLSRGIAVLANRTSADLELSDELSHYVEQSATERVARGSSRESARREALLEIGNMTVARERVRSYGWENVVGSVLGDLRYALRRLRQAPGFTLVAVITLALGIGASTAIFSAVNPIFFAALPYPNAQQLVMISDRTSDGEPLAVTFGSYLEIARRSHSFMRMAPVNEWQPAMIGSGTPERLVGQRVGANFFRTLGVTPKMGRDFTAHEDVPHGPNVVILSHGLWQRRFGGDANIIGRLIRLGESDFEVVGVMPATFENVLTPTADIWAPLQYELTFGAESREWGHHLRLVARLAPGASVDRAKLELDQIARAPIAEFPRVPWAALNNGLLATSMQADVTQGIRPMLIAVLVAVMLVLAIVCVNVTNLMLARGAQRRGEFAMRAALGAGRTRLARQVLTESLTLAIAGGVLGMFVAEAGIHALVALSPAGLPRASAMRLDGAVFAFGLIITTVVGIVAGILPALGATGQDLHSGTKESSARTAGSDRGARGALVVAEVALALVLLVSAGLLLKSINRVLDVSVGFDSSHLLTMQVQQLGRAQTDSSEAARIDSARNLEWIGALEAVRRVPGVAAASFVSLLPLSGDRDTYGVHFEGDNDANDERAALRYAVTSGFFEAMKIPLRHGRLLDARDVAGAPRSAVINESFAKRKFAGADVVGKRLRFGPQEGDWYTIVGVVGDVKQSSLSVDVDDAVYMSPAQWHWVDNTMSLVVRARGDATTLTPAIRDAIWSTDKDLPISRIATMHDLVDRSLADRRFAMILFVAFGVTALILAAVGIHGVLSGSVTERLREIGVRAALGASPADVVRMVLRKGMTLTGAGIAVGLIASGVASRVVVSMLFGVSRLDPATYLSVAALLSCVAGVACVLPALRAARVDPSSTLKAT